MKNKFHVNKSQLIVFFALLSATGAFASDPCPNLAGAYVCQGAAGTITITQQEEGGGMTYEINGIRIIPGGQASAAGDNTDFQGAESYSCQGGALVRKLSMGPASTIETYTADAQGLHIARSLEVPGHSQPQNQVTCARSQ